MANNKFYRVIASVKPEWEGLFSDMIRAYNECKEKGEATCWLDILCRVNLEERRVEEDYLYYYKWLRPALCRIGDNGHELLVETCIGGSCMDPGTEEEAFFGTFCDRIYQVQEVASLNFLGAGEVECAEVIRDPVPCEYEKGKKLVIDKTIDLDLYDMSKPVIFELHTAFEPGFKLMMDVIFNSARERVKAQGLKQGEELLLLEWLTTAGCKNEELNTRLANNRYLNETPQCADARSWYKGDENDRMRIMKTNLLPYLKVECWDDEVIRFRTLKLQEGVFDDLIAGLGSRIANVSRIKYV
jgi:hypothetical protein